MPTRRSNFELNAATADGLARRIIGHPNWATDGYRLLAVQWDCAGNVDAAGIDAMYNRFGIDGNNDFQLESPVFAAEVDQRDEYDWNQGSTGLDDSVAFRTLDLAAQQDPELDAILSSEQLFVDFSNYWFNVLGADRSIFLQENGIYETDFRPQNLSGGFVNRVCGYLEKAGVATMRTTNFALTAALLLTVGCGQTEPVLSPSNGADLSIDARASDRSAHVVDGSTAARPGASTETMTTLPSDSASTTTPAPPPTLTETEPTSPTTRRPTASTTSAGPSTDTPAPPTDPVAVAQSPDGVVDFRIPPGTQAGPWNTFEARVRVMVGQTLRIHNDDVVAHTLHSNGTPVAHGPTIQPGEAADHLVVATLTPDPSTPVNYDHNGGVIAPFWVEAIPTGEGASGANEPANLVAAESESLRLLADLRAGLGIQPVSPSDTEMHAFARAWSLEMRNTGFRHSDSPPWFENIVWYSDETMTPTEAAAQFHDMWVNSPGHYENMMNPDWSVVGIGMWHDETGWWGVHVFR